MVVRKTLFTTVTVVVIIVKTPIRNKHFIVQSNTLLKSTVNYELLRIIIPRV